MEEYKIAILLTAFFTGIIMIFAGISASGVCYRAYVAHKEYKLKEKKYTEYRKK